MTALLKNSSSQDRVSDLLPGDAAPAAPVCLRSSRAAGAASFVSIRVSPAMAILLKALAAHDGLPGIDALIADMAEERARAVGVPRLLRAVRNHEASGSTNCPHARSDLRSCAPDGAPELSGGVRSDARPMAANPVQQGREAVSHLVHTQEVGSSNLPPATSSVLTAEHEALPRWPADNAPETSGGLRSQPGGACIHNPESLKGPEGVPLGALRSPP